MFLAMLPISRTGGSAADISAIIRLFFRHGVLVLATCLPGSESSQVISRTKSNAVFSLF